MTDLARRVSELCSRVDRGQARSDSRGSQHAVAFRVGAAMAAVFATGTATVMLPDGDEALFLVAHNIDPEGLAFIKALLGDRPGSALSLLSDGYADPVPTAIHGAPAWTASRAAADRARIVDDVLLAAAGAALAASSDDPEHVQVLIDWPDGDPAVAVNAGSDALRPSELLLRILKEIGPLPHLRAVSAPAIAETFSKTALDGVLPSHPQPWYGVQFSQEIELAQELDDPIARLRLVARSAAAAQRLGIRLDALVETDIGI